MQIITLIGTIVADAECKTARNNSEFVAFRLAANEYRGEEKIATYYDVTFIKNGLFPYLKKGKKVCVVGKLGLSVTQKDDKAFLNAAVNANHIEFCSSSQDGE